MGVSRIQRDVLENAMLYPRSLSPTELQLECYALDFDEAMKDVDIDQDILIHFQGVESVEIVWMPEFVGKAALKGMISRLYCG